MRAMKLSRLGAGAGLTIVLLTAWLGACSTTDNEVCGADGIKNGICQSGPTCPSGSSVIAIADPSDQCPSTNRAGGTDYICCGPTSSTGGGSTTSTTTTTTTTPDAASTSTASEGGTQG